IFKNYPNLKVIASMGAGVDHITSDPDIDENIKITRIVDEQLTVDMGAFVLALIMEHLRNLSYHHNSKEWKPRSYKKIKDTRVGIMGMGVLGGGVAKILKANGFKISGWTKTPQEQENIDIYSGPENLEDFLHDLSILV